MDAQTWMISNLRFQIKHLKDEISAFRSGEKYRQMEKACREEIAYVDRRYRTVKNELNAALKEIERVRNGFMPISLLRGSRGSKRPL